MKIILKTLTFIVVIISILLPSNASWSTETLDNILSKYNTRLLKMRMNEKTNITLEEQYFKAYDMLPKYKKKRLAKEAEAK